MQCGGFGAVRFWMVLGLCPVLAWAQTPAPASEGSARCRRLRAEARSRAAVLGAPRLEAQAFRQPAAGDPGATGTMPSQGTQLRAGLGWSPIDRLKGGAVERAADADCEALAARDALAELLMTGSAFGEAGALRAQAGVLENGLAQTAPLLERARERLARRIDTLLDVDELESRVARLRTDWEGTKRRLSEYEAQGAAAGRAVPMARLVTDYERAALAAAKARSDERRLDAWRVDLRAGAVPWPKADWFGMASVSWSIGAGEQARSERAALGARAEELEVARDEMRSRTARFAAVLREGLPALERELAVTREQCAVVRDRRALAGEGSDAMARLKDRYLLEAVGLEARTRYIETLVAARRAVLEGA